MPNLVQPLISGPIDVIGDIHGEIEPLTNLLGHLGYDAVGRHPAGRRIVFVGDLTDRGPDSPAVVRLLRELVESGRAQGVLGNHELNLLLGQHKYDNGWFFRQVFHDEQGRLVPQRVADAEVQQEVLRFFRTLPLALEREDLRVVHACWNAEAIEAVRHESDVLRCYERHRVRIESALSAGSATDEVERNLRHQNDNPVKLLTSGPERRAREPYFSSGLRTEERITWWTHYADEPWCLFGHYGSPEHRFQSRAVCIDYGIAKRWQERRLGLTSAFKRRLAAARFPERHLVFDDGELREIKTSVEATAL